MNMHTTVAFTICVWLCTKDCGIARLDKLVGHKLSLLIDLIEYLIVLLEYIDTISQTVDLVATGP